MPMRTRIPLGRLLSARCTSMLHRTACSGSAKAIMNPSPWLLTTWPVMALHVAADHLVVPADQPHPCPVADALVERRRLLDVGEHDRDLAVRRQPRQVGPLHLGPVGEVLDRRADRGAEALLADDVRRLPHRLDGLATAGQQHVAGVDAAAQLVGLASGAGRAAPTARRARPPRRRRRPPARRRRSASRSPVKYWMLVR